jgi:hypothetical protein
MHFRVSLNFHHHFTLDPPGDTARHLLSVLLGIARRSIGLDGACFRQPERPRGKEASEI